MVVGALVLVMVVGLVRYSGAWLDGQLSTSAVITRVVGAVVFMLTILLLARFAHHTEHGLRSESPVAQSYVASEAFGAAKTTAVRTYRPMAITRPGALMFGRTYSPGSRAGGAVLFAALALVFVALAINGHSKAVRSAYVQAHGTRAAAVVGAVGNRKFCGSWRTGCQWGTARIEVQLLSPVDHRTTTVVHYPGYSALVTGDRVTVLVDPRQPTYAELAGSPLQTRQWWLLYLAGALASAGVAAWNARLLLGLRRHRQEHFAGATVGRLTSSSA